MTRRFAALLLATALIAAAAPAFAQGYPTGPIRILVGFGPGSTADTLARLVGKHMEQAFGQPVVVENRPGNSSMIAAETVARAAPDGYTLFMATVAQTLNPAHDQIRLRPVQADGAGRAAGRSAEHAGRASRCRGEKPEGSGRAREEQARWPDLRHLGRRDREPSGGGIVQPEGRHQDRGGALSGRQQSGADRSARRPHHADVQRRGDARAACEGGQAQRARNGAAEARRHHAGPSDHGRSRHAGLRCRHLDRAACAGRNPGRHRRQAVEGRQRCAEDGAGDQGDVDAGHRHPRRHAEGVRRHSSAPISTSGPLCRRRRPPRNRLRSHVKGSSRSRIEQRRSSSSAPSRS